jgi:3'-phosphoadenosine 5'-phosphosulfate sulfotransferase (PAPS reductase)/FAD synthetase
MQASDKLRWRLRIKTAEYRRHVGYAVSAIHAAQEAARMVVSWSTGKDSTAMTHLVRSLYPDTPIMIQFDDCDWPTKRAYADRVATAQGWDVHRVEPEFSVWERMQTGRIGEDEFCAQSHSLTQDAFLKPLAEQQHSLGCNGVYMGLRAEESKARNVHLRSRGEHYQLASGEWRCCPLARWTSEDVFAYMTEHGIEINPCYFNNRFLPPEEIRVSWAIPTPGSLAHGDMEHYRHYYPEQFRRMREMGVC